MDFFKLFWSAGWFGKTRRVHACIHGHGHVSLSSSSMLHHVVAAIAISIYYMDMQLATSNGGRSKYHCLETGLLQGQ